MSDVKQIFEGNNALSRDYMSVVGQCSMTHRSIRGLIAEADVDIRLHFEKHATLKALEVSGIGQRTLEILELILKEGRSTAIATIRQRKIQAAQYEPHERQPITSVFSRDEAAREERKRRTLEEENEG